MPFTIPLVVSQLHYPTRIYTTEWGVVCNELACFTCWWCGCSRILVKCFNSGFKHRPIIVCKTKVIVWSKIEALQLPTCYSVMCKHHKPISLFCILECFVFIVTHSLKHFNPWTRYTCYWTIPAISNPLKQSTNIKILCVWEQWCIALNNLAMGCSCHSAYLWCWYYLSTK